MNNEEQILAVLSQMLEVQRQSHVNPQVLENAVAKEKEAPAVIIDNPNIPEVFASEVVGILMNAGNVHITFASPRVTHGVVNRAVVARLVIPISSAQNLAVGLYDFLKKHGVDLAQKPAKGQMQ